MKIQDVRQRDRVVRTVITLIMTWIVVLILGGLLSIAALVRYLLQ